MQYSLLQQLSYEFRSVLLGYPRFVFARRPEALENEVPVFVYHTIDPVMFEQQLEFLQENGYRTLSIDAFVRYLQSKGELPPNAVLLTVDDARSSFWRYGFPLLEKYEMQATLFVIPGRTLEATACRPNLMQVWAGEMSAETLAQEDPDDATLCTWQELETMHASGRVSIQSHTLFHREVFIDTRVLNFVSKDTLFLPYNSPVTPYLTFDDIGKALALDKFLGMPLFPAAPLLAGQSVMLLQPEALTFFQDVARRYALSMPASRDVAGARTAIEAHLQQNRPPFLSEADVERTITEDLILSRELIQKRLGPAAGTHLCLPYTVGSEVAIHAAKKAGMQSCFWGTIPGRRYNRPGYDPFRIVRIKNDFIWRLPGNRRKGLLDVYLGKATRRVHKEPVY